jgi:hypothetical protein
MEWKPIETAPKDGTIIFIAEGVTGEPPRHVRLAYWPFDPPESIKAYGEGFGWQSPEGGYIFLKPRVWMPNPKMPNL